MKKGYRNHPLNKTQFVSFKLLKKVLCKMFTDVLQEALESEMDTHLSYNKYEISEKSTDIVNQLNLKSDTL